MFKDINDESVRAYDQQFLDRDLGNASIAVVASVDKVYQKGEKKDKPFTNVTYEVLQGDFKGSRLTIKYDHTVEEINKNTGDTYAGGIPLMRRIAIACGHYEVKENNEKHVKKEAGGTFNPEALIGKKFVGDIKTKKNGDYWNYRIFNEREFVTFPEPIQDDRDKIGGPDLENF
ncbi:hypothetical protein LCGC14_0452170 [marine sediment metagenome]|uniref:Uncharacterized protein n=1 Tax=marine sediment metagenome TaxID=412755 RepID=A0A0F9V4B2_9ZZZZ